MRALRITLASLALAFCTGCEVIGQINDEIGYSDEELGKSKPAEETAADGGDPKDPNSVEQRTANWWKNATTLGPAKKTGKDAMVRCKVSGSERFTRVNDCVAAGGTVLE